MRKLFLDDGGVDNFEPYFTDEESLTMFLFIFIWKLLDVVFVLGILAVTDLGFGGSAKIFSVWSSLFFFCLANGFGSSNCLTACSLSTLLILLVEFPLSFLSSAICYCRLFLKF